MDNDAEFPFYIIDLLAAASNGADGCCREGPCGRVAGGWGADGQAGVIDGGGQRADTELIGGQECCCPERAKQCGPHLFTSGGPAGPDIAEWVEYIF